MSEESVSLRFKQGSSDKTYNAELIEAAGGWLVNFSYGRTGGTLTAGTKTAQPTDLDAAKIIYDKLVHSKTSKGYSPEGDGVPFAGTTAAGSVTGYQPQLLNPMDQDDIIAMIKADPDAWFAQEKYDGERRGLKLESDTLVGSNRRGLEVPVRSDVADALAALGLKGLEFDAEDMGDYVVVFDVLGLNNSDLRSAPASQRLRYLTDLKDLIDVSKVSVHIRTAQVFEFNDEDDVEALIAEFREINAEGLVFKRKDAPYEPGKPASGGTQFKLKFTHDCTVRVANHTEGKRSVGMEILDQGVWTGVGKVTVPANKDMPAIGALIDVNYLYAYPNGGSLFQPQFRSERTDYLEADCTTEQLNYKPQTGPEDEDATLAM